MRWETLAVVTGFVPIAWLWWTHRKTALVYAASWAIAAWAAWTLEAQCQCSTSRYFAMSLTACAGVAVLGARRPGAGPWNIVVGGLAAVLMLPVGQSFFAGSTFSLDSMWMWFLGGVIAVGCFNYVPSLLRWPAGVMLIVCLMNMGYINKGPMPKDQGLVEYMVAVAPWSAAVCLLRSKRNPTDLLGIWFGFRDRYGAVWATRIIWQFNAAAKNAKSDVQLRMEGVFRKDMRLSAEHADESARKTLVPLLQRFDWP